MIATGPAGERSGRQMNWPGVSACGFASELAVCPRAANVKPPWADAIPAPHASSATADRRLSPLQILFMMIGPSTHLRARSAANRGKVNASGPAPQLPLDCVPLLQPVRLFGGKM